MPSPLYPVLGRSYKITTADHGNIPMLGNAAEGCVGTWLVHWVPDLNFTGSLALVGRAYGQPASDAVVAVLGVPYRRVNINGVASDYGFDSVALTGPSIVTAPANGLALGFLVSCSAGTGMLYTWPLEGPCAP